MASRARPLYGIERPEIWGLPKIRAVGAAPRGARACVMRQYLCSVWLASAT